MAERAGRARAVIVGGLGVACVAGCAIGAWWAARPFWLAYLTAWSVGLDLVGGAAVVVLIYMLVGGRWGEAVGRRAAGLVRLTPVVVLAAAPLFVAARWVWPWMSDAGSVADEAIRWRMAYLSPGFAAVRAVSYLAVWIVGAMLLMTRTRGRVDASGGATPAVGLVIYLLTMSFASIDWFASLDEHWYSTVYGLYRINGQMTAALALLIVTMRGDQEGDERTLIDTGNLLLAGVVMWGYLGFSQYLIIWNGNLPQEVLWYVERTRGGWGVVAIVLIALHLALPLVLLLSREVKRRAEALRAIAGVVLMAHVLDVVWMIVPSAREQMGVTLMMTAGCTAGVAMIGAALMRRGGVA